MSESKNKVLEIKDDITQISLKMHAEIENRVAYKYNYKEKR